MANVSLKQRLIGAVVLISHAVIFIPMLFDVDKDSDMTIRGSNLPPEPKYEFKTITLPNPNLTHKSEAPDVEIVDDVNKDSIGKELQTITDAKASTSDTEHSQAIATKDDVKQDDEINKLENNANQESETTPDIPDKHQETKVPGNRDSTTNKDGSEQKKGITTWSVQVGSFSTKENAFELRDRLRNKGFASYVEAVSAKNGKTYRVRVGPELSRVLAESLEKKLKNQAQVDGLVIRH